LKLLWWYLSNKKVESHPSRVRGLKPLPHNHKNLLLAVAPFTGAWIETIGVESRK